MKTALFAAAAAATSVAAFAATPAMAQDVSAPEPFSQFHVEGLLGLDINKAGSSVDQDVPAPRHNSDGMTYGVGAGYDFRFNRIVIGPEAEVSWSTAKTNYNDGDYENFGIGNVKANRDIYVGARAGYVVTPSTMVYVKGGYTNAKYDARSGGGYDLHHDMDLDGWRVGAGVEHQLTKSTFVKLEYRYSNYSKGHVDFSGDIPDSSPFDVDVDRHQIVAGFGVNF